MSFQTSITKLNSTRFRFVLMVFLVLLAAASSFFVATKTSGLIFIVGVLGFAMVVLTLFYPIVGFYFCIGLSFFIFDIVRFIDTDLPAVAFLDVMVYITFAGVLINKLVKKEPFWIHCDNPIVFMYLGILGYFIFQFFNPNGGNPELYFLSSRRFIALLLFLYCSIQLFTDFNSIFRFFKVILGLAVFAGLYACYQQLVGMPRYEVEAMFRDPNLQQQILMYIALGSLRKCSFLSDCTAFGLLSSGTAIIAIVFFMKLKASPWKRMMLGGFVLILGLAMSFSGTRTATVMLLAEIAMYMLMTINEFKTFLFFVAFGLLSIAIIFTPSYGNKTLPRLRTTFDFGDASLNVRNVNRHNIQPYIYTHPIGGGVRTTGVVYEKYNVGHPLAGFPTDSGLLSLVLEMGWVGLLLQCITYFVFLRLGVRGYYRSKDPTFKVLMLASTLTLFGYVVAQYSQLAISQVPSGFLFYALLAVIIRLPQIEKKELILKQ